MPSDPLSYRPFRLEVRGTLVPLNAFRIGTGERLSLSTDAPVLLDSATGEPYIPGTSLRGVLRSHLESEAPLLGHGDTEIEILFGRTPPGEDQESWAGRLSVFDAYSTKPSHREVRDHVRQNPKWGAADHGAKFDAEVALPSENSSFAFCMIYEGESAEDPELVLVHEAIRLLGSGQLTIGGKSGWGYGRFQLKDLQTIPFDRTTTAGLASYFSARLGSPSPSSSAFSFPPAGTPREAASAISTITFRLCLHFEGPALVKAPIPPLRNQQSGCKAGNPQDPATYSETGLLEADHVFLHRLHDGQYYLPGSSLRGVLRSQALRIEHADAITLFGSVKSKNDQGRRGLIDVSDGELVGAPCPVFLDHVAIDRITAAAVDAKKFSQSALASPKFDLSIRARFKPDQTKAVRLAAFLVRDLMLGRLWAGSGVSRGYGYIRRADLLSVSGDLLVSSGGRNRFAQEGTFQFDDPSLLWLWNALETSGELA